MTRLAMTVATPPINAFRLADELRLQSATAETKAERTRLTLLASAAALLDDLPFMQMRPADLAAHADVSRALIYHRFTDLAALVTEVMEVFERRLTLDLASMAPRRTRFDYDYLVRYLAWTLSIFMRNRGLMRLLLSDADQVPGVGPIVDRILHAFNKILGDAATAPEGIRWGSNSRLVVGYLIGGGVSDLLRRMLHPGHDQLLAPQSATEMFELVQTMALVRHREMHGSDPTLKEIRAVAKAFDLGAFESCLPADSSAAPVVPHRQSMQRLRRMAAKASA